MGRALRSQGLRRDHLGPVTLSGLWLICCLCPWPWVSGAGGRVRGVLSTWPPSELWPRPLSWTFLGCQDFLWSNPWAWAHIHEAPGEADRKGPWVLQAGEALDEAALLLARCACGNREVERPSARTAQEPGPGDKEMAHARWLPSVGGGQRHGWLASRSALHVGRSICCVVGSLSGTLLYCLLTIPLMVVPPDPWICTPATPTFAGTGLEACCPPASQEQPFYLACIAQVWAVAERALSWGRVTAWDTQAQTLSWPLASFRGPILLSWLGL